MEKIYNNLSVENLTKTDWFKKFNVHQKYEISEGLKDNLDISIYAIPEFSWQQMSEIRGGLRNNLDVSCYAKPGFDDFQMEQIREKLLKKSTL